MKIATVVTGHFTTPPSGLIHAPMDVAAALSKGLEERGHEVTFFAPKGSKIGVSRVENGGLPPLWQGKGHKILKTPGIGPVEISKLNYLWDQYLLALMYREASLGKFDLLHIHPVDRALPFGYAFRGVPSVYTLHDPIYPWRAEAFRMFASPNQHYVSISDAQREPAKNLNWLATVYNGLDAAGVPFSGKPGDYLLFVGRINPNKGAAEAIDVAEKTGERLLIAGSFREDSPYWREKIKPRLKGKISYVGLLSKKELYQHYKNAKALLFPIQWEEPFGLVMIEAMATGAPVIAFNCGSVPEIIKDGKTGFIVKSVAEMAAAIKKIDKINRADCRRHVEEKFSLDTMIDGYEKAFYSLVRTSIARRR